MKNDFYLDERAYQELLDACNNLHFTEIVGGVVDFNLMYDDYWLQDSAVIENIKLVQGEWEIYLIFAHYKNPYRLIKRKITSCFCQSKAQTFARYMRRQAAKDQRGTLQVDQSMFQYNGN